ncbi:MAG TPA: hypothetical protein VMG41_15070 [Gemmatimonadales bacterium]|nr:hypothetical protein [Gemmatimonadales bacterium]
MLRLRRSGFTLAGVMIGMVLLGLIGLILVRLHLAAERGLRALRGHASLQEAFDLAAAFMTSELADVGRQGPDLDLIRAERDALAYRATRGSGLACAVGGTEVLISRERWRALRSLQAGRDSLLLLLRPRAGDSSSRWVAAPILGVGSASCEGRSSLRMGTVIDASRWTLPAPPALVPVRAFEVMEARLYASGSQEWMGARSVSSGEAIQPLTGPFSVAGSGLTYQDSTGSPAAALADIRSIDLRLAGTRPHPGVPGSVVSESLQTRLAPRNLR